MLGTVKKQFLEHVQQLQAYHGIIEAVLILLEHLHNGCQALLSVRVEMQFQDETSDLRFGKSFRVGIGELVLEVL